MQLENLYSMREVDLHDEALAVDGLIVQPFSMRMPLVRWPPILLPLDGLLLLGEITNATCEDLESMTRSFSLPAWLPSA